MSWPVIIHRYIHRSTWLKDKEVESQNKFGNMLPLHECDWPNRKEAFGFSGLCIGGPVFVRLRRFDYPPGRPPIHNTRSNLCIYCYLLLCMSSNQLLLLVICCWQWSLLQRRRSPKAVRPARAAYSHHTPWWVPPRYVGLRVLSNLVSMSCV
jgi:hypothetical protein